MKSVKRLYTELKPSHYTLALVPDSQTLVFKGTVTIDLKKAGRPSQRLTFHQHGLKVTSASVVKHDKKGDQPLMVRRINNQNTLDEVRVHTAELVYSGDYTITLEFNGQITKSMTGLYPCRFMLDGQEHIVLATQFESHYAREVFPCIDEPEAKATFDLSITAPQDVTVLANTPVANQTQVDSSNVLVTTFETTPKMSTYLLAFVIGELQSVTTMTNKGTEVSIWASIAQPLATLEYALDIAKRSVEFFENYFGVPYPLPKLDNVAIPDIGASTAAMENWGLITYRESVLVAYPNELSQTTSEYIAMVVGHEISHQWFGNLVTMRWWNDLWLNESFANMMEYQVVDHLFPEWHIWDEFISREGLAALRRDATKGVQAVQSIVRHPLEINTIFDPYIVYAKGGRLLYMLKTYLGEETFRKGLSLYFKTHAYGNTTSDDLWHALSEASGINIGAFMKPWLEQSGFPVVSVGTQDHHVTLEQTHFLEDGQRSDGRLWPIPLFASDSNVPKRLDKKHVQATHTGDNTLVVNNHAAGHYIVDYQDPGHRAELTKQIASQKLSPVDRLMLLNYASMLAKAGRQSFGDVLMMLDAYQTEQSEPVWGIIALVLAEARRFIDLNETLEPRIKTFIRTLIQKEYTRLGWEEKPDESPADRKLRATIIGLGVYAEEPAIVKEALKRFEAYKTDPSSTVTELRGILFSAAIRNEAAGAYDYLIELHDSTTNADLKEDISAGLTATHNPEIGKKILARLTDPKLVKPQDFIHWYVYSLRNRYIRELAWDWLVTHWGWLEETYGNDKAYDDFPRYAAGVCNTKAWAEKYAAFFTPKRANPALKRNIDIALNEIKTRVAWLERDQATVEKFFV